MNHSFDKGEVYKMNYEEENDLLNGDDKVLSVKHISSGITEVIEIQLQDRKIIITPGVYGGEAYLFIDEEYRTK